MLEATAFIASDSALAAGEWLDELQSKIGSLALMPNRFAFIPEKLNAEHRYRAFVHHSHRVIYRVDEAKKVVMFWRCGISRASRSSGSPMHEGGTWR